MFMKMRHLGVETTAAASPSSRRTAVWCAPTWPWRARSQTR